MRKSLAAATVAASLTIGGAAGAALFTPTLSGAQTADDPTTQPESDATERPRLEDRLGETLAPLVADATITQDQADAVIAAIAADLPERPFGGRGHHGFGRGIGSEVADVLGLSTEELRTQLADGATLREVAEDQGVDPQAVVDAIVAEAQTRADQAVADGRLTEDEAAERVAEASERATEALDRSFEGRPFGPGHDHDADDTDDAGDDTVGS